MPNTRSSRARNSAEVENQEKNKNQTLTAKSAITTRSSRNNKTTRQYLQNITNPKVSSLSDKKQTNRKQPAAKMGSNNNEELSDNSATTSLETNATVESTPELMARLKRKSVDDNDFLRAIATASPTKKFKDAEIELLFKTVNGLTNMEVVESMDVDQVEVEIETTEPAITPSPVMITESPQLTPPAPIKTQPPVIVDDGEKPSTSKAAMAALAASTAAATIAAAEAEAKAAILATTSSPKIPSSPSTTASTTGRKMKSLRKQRISIATSTDSEDQQSTVHNDVNSNLSTGTKKEPMPLPDKLLLLISNLYLNAAERLKLDFPPRCAEDLEHCHQYHYRAALPEAPNHTQANNLRCALQQQRYVSFVNLSYDMCHRGEYPGEGIFTKLIELVLSFNAKSYNNDSLGYFFNKSIELFSFIVRKFPPCWLTLRKLYIKFLQTPLDVKKISKKDEQPFKADNVLEIIFELLFKTVDQCSIDDLQNDADSFNVSPRAVPTTPPTDAAAATTASKQDDSNMETSIDALPKFAEVSQNSEYMNMWEWEVQENRLQTFEALKSSRTRLERLVISLQLLLQILESDFVMWILHHHKKAKEFIFCEDNRPFVVIVFKMSKYTRSTEVVKQLFELFSICVSKRARRSHLEILERYISLVMVASNIADLERSVLGLHYPNLGAGTKTLIQDFFKIFKSHNTALVSSYLNAIDLLRIPFVRYEFIDCFLQLFHFAGNEPIAPKKIATDLYKKRWLKYKPKAEMPADSGDDLSREQYMQLLLTALQAYCDFHGLRSFFQLLTDEESFQSFRFVTDSVHRYPTKGCGTLMLDRLGNDIKQLEKQLRMTVRMSKPKATLPLVVICVNDEVLQKYRTDLKYVMVLNEIIAWQPKAEQTTKTTATTTEAMEVAKDATTTGTMTEATDVAKDAITTTTTTTTTTDEAKKATAASSVDYTAWRKFLSDYATVAE